MDSIFSQGKTFISSRRANQLSGYSMDYIGQLCRADKVEATQVGRVWFVTEESLMGYKAHSEELAQKRHQEQSAFSKSVYSAEEPLLPKLTKPVQTGGNHVHKKIPHQLSFSDSLSRAFLSLVLVGSAAVGILTIGDASFPATALAEFGNTFTGVYRDIASVPRAIARNVSGGLEAFGEIVEAKPIVGKLALDVKESLFKGNEPLLALGFVGEASDVAQDSFATGFAKVTGGTNTIASVPGAEFVKKFLSFFSTSEDTKNSVIAPALLAEIATTSDLLSGAKVPVLTVSTSTGRVAKTEKTMSFVGAAPRIVERVINNTVTNNTIERVLVGEVTQAELDSRLNDIYGKIQNQLASLSTGSGGSITNIYQTIAQTQKIDHLANTTVSTPSINGGTLSNVSITGSSLESAPSVTTAALTVTGSATSSLASGINITSGCFAINGVCLTAGGGSGSGSGGVQSGLQGQIAFYDSATSTVSATSSIFISPDQNVGIGTTIPDSKLTVSSDSIDSPTFSLYPATGQTANMLNVYGSSGLLTTVVDSVGNLGIGTSTPGTKLAVVGQSNLDGQVTIASNNNAPQLIVKASPGQSTNVVEFRGSDDVARLSIFDLNGAPRIFFNYGDWRGGDFTGQFNGVDQMSFGFSNVGSFGGTPNHPSGRLLYFFDRVASAYRGAVGPEGDLFWGTNSISRYSVKLGAPDPFKSPLTIQGAPGQSANLFEVNSNGVPGGGVAVISSAGNLGIGEQNPQSPLSVYSSNGNYAEINNADGNVFKISKFADPTIGVDLNQADGFGNGPYYNLRTGGTLKGSFGIYAGDVYFYTVGDHTNFVIGGSGLDYMSTIIGRSNKEALIVNASTTFSASDIAQVPVSIVTGGTQTANAFQISSKGTAGGDRLVLDSSGKLGVGTSTPSAKFALTGTGVATNRAFALATTANAESFSILNNGKTVIGLTTQGSPALVSNTVLTVNGPGRFGISGETSAGAYGISLGGSASDYGVIGTNVAFGSGSTRTYIGNGAAAWFEFGAGGSVGFVNAISGTAGAAITGTNRFQITSGGNVGIGTTSPYAALSVVGSTGVVAEKFTATSTAATSTFSGGLSVGSVNSLGKLHVSAQAPNNPVAYFVNTNTGANDGVLHLGVGAASAGTSNLYVSFYQGSTDTSRGTRIGYIQGSGSNSVTYNTTSDVRLKENIHDTSLGLEDLLKIGVKDYNFKTSPGKTVQGFIAQDLNKIYPYAVATTDDGVSPLGINDIPWGVDYGRITPLIVKSIQDQYALYKKLEGRVADIEARIASTSPSSTSSGGFSMDSVISVLQSAGLSMVNGVANVRDLVTETATVGSELKPTGITLYDKQTGQPYCLEISNGAMLQTPGKCSVTVRNPVPVVTESASSTPTVVPEATLDNSTTTPSTVTTSTPEIATTTNTTTGGTIDTTATTTTP